MYKFLELTKYEYSSVKKLNQKLEVLGKWQERMSST